MGETISKSIANCTCPDGPPERLDQHVGQQLEAAGDRLDRIERMLDRLIDRPYPPAPILDPAPDPAPLDNLILEPDPVPRAEIPAEAPRAKAPRAEAPPAEAPRAEESPPH